MAETTTANDRLRDALLRAADLLAATTTTRLVLQRIARVVEPGHVPGELRGPVLERLRAAGEPEPLAWREVEGRLRRAWGTPPARVLDDIDEHPVAVTPAAQVHRAVADGDDVAVKVRRAGVAEAVRGDLALLDAVAPLFAGVAPRADVAALVAEVRERALDELDLEHEATVQRAFHRALRRHEDLHVPAPRTDLAREDVLVAAWVEGTSVRALQGGPEDARRRVAELAVRFFLGAAQHGTAHADPDPDDVLLLGDGGVAVLDYGAVARVPPSRAARCADLLEAVAAGQDGAAAEALADLGWLPAADTPSAVALARAAVGPLLASPARMDAGALRAASGRALESAHELLALLPRTAFPPGDLSPLRGAGALALLLARLDVEADWVGLATRALREGW
jgi:hypothetical protein